MLRLILFLSVALQLSLFVPARAQDTSGRWSVGVLAGPALTHREIKDNLGIRTSRRTADPEFRLHGGILAGYTGRSGLGFRVGLFPYNRFSTIERNILIMARPADTVCNCERIFDYDLLELPLLFYFSPMPEYRVRAQFSVGIVPGLLMARVIRTTGLPEGYETRIPNLPEKIRISMNEEDQYRPLQFSSWVSTGAVYDHDRHWQFSLNGVWRTTIRSLLSESYLFRENLYAYQLTAGATYRF